MAKRTKAKKSKSSRTSRARRATGYRGGGTSPRTKKAERGGGQTLHDEEQALSPDITPDTGSEEILPAGPGGNMAAERRRMVGQRTPAPESRRPNPEVEPEAQTGPEDTPPAA